MSELVVILKNIEPIGFKDCIMIKMAILIIIGITAVIAISIFLAGMIPDKPIDENTQNETTSKVEITPEGLGHPDAVSSGPLTITQYQHKLSENVFIVVSGLE